MSFGAPRSSPGEYSRNPQEDGRLMRLNVMGQSHMRLAGLASGIPGGDRLAEIHAGRTVSQWFDTVRDPPLKNMQDRVEGLMKSMNEKISSTEKADELVKPLSRQCHGLLRDFHSMAYVIRGIDGKPGDIPGLGRMIDRNDLLNTFRNIKEEIKVLPASEQAPFLEALKVFDDAKELFRDPHPAVKLVDKKTLFGNSEVRGRFIQGGAMIGTVALGIPAIITTFLALHTKEGANWTVPFLYWAGAAGLANYDKLSKTGQQAFRSELGWLREPISATERDGRKPIRSLADLRSRGYGISGNSWATFAERLYTTEARQIIGGAMYPFAKNFTENDDPDPNKPRSQFTRLLDLVPDDIKDEVKKMLNSRDDSSQPRTEAERKAMLNGAHFRAFVSLLNRATSPRAREQVIRFIRSGTEEAPLQEIPRNVA